MINSRSQLDPLISFLFALIIPESPSGASVLMSYCLFNLWKRLTSVEWNRDKLLADGDKRNARATDCCENRNGDSSGGMSALQTNSADVSAKHISNYIPTGHVKGIKLLCSLSLSLCVCLHFLRMQPKKIQWQRCFFYIIPYMVWMRSLRIRSDGKFPFSLIFPIECYSHWIIISQSIHRAPRAVSRQ